MLIALAVVLVVAEYLLAKQRAAYLVVAAEIALLLWVALGPDEARSLPAVLPILLVGHLIASMRGRRWAGTRKPE